MCGLHKPNEVRTMDGHEDLLICQDNRPLTSLSFPAVQLAKKENLSKEMKARLRAEYTGFGGAENSVSG
jgi:hypothetical protein